MAVDVTFFELEDGTKVEILNFLDDFSRVCMASKVLATIPAPTSSRPLRSGSGAVAMRYEPS